MQQGRLDRGHRAKYGVAGAIVVGALGVGSALAAPVDVGVGRDANGDYLAVSHGGNAYSSTVLAVSTTGCAGASGAWLGGISGTGCADGGPVGISGMGPVGYNSPSSPTGTTTFFGASGTSCARTFFVAVSGAGCANSRWAVSGTGDAQGQGEFYVPYAPPIAGPGLAVSGTGNAGGGFAAVAPDGNATSGSFSSNSVVPTTVTAPGIAVAGTGTATGGTAAVAGGNAYAPGGVVAVSGTGQARGATVNIGMRGAG